MQIAGVTQETCSSALVVSGAPVPGTACTVQRVPFHASISDLAPCSPAATQWDATGQDTLKKADPGSGAMRCAVHLPPAYRSAKAVKPGVSASPTATQPAGSH